VVGLRPPPNKNKFFICLFFVVGCRPPPILFFLSCFWIVFVVGFVCVFSYAWMRFFEQDGSIWQ
jgi:hypothetical protein